MIHIKALKFIVLSAFLSLNIIAVQAQPTGDENSEQISIIQNYQPILADAVKLNFNPELPGNSFEKPALSYQLPSRSLDLPYQSPSVRPLAMKPLPLDPLKNVYAKVGAGNKALPFIDFYVNSGRSGKYNNKTDYFNWGLHGGFVNAPAGIENQTYTELKTNAFVQYYVDKVELSGQVNYNQDNIRFYGYNHDSSFTANQVKQIYHFVNGTFAVNNAKKTSYKIDYSTKLDYNYLWDIRKHREINPVFKGVINKEFDNGHQLNIGILLDYTSYAFDTLKNNRTILSVTPNYKLGDDNWFVKIGLNGGVDEDGFYLFPDALFQRELIGKGLVFYSGWHGGIEKNNLKTISDINPYLSDTLSFHNSRSQNRFMGFKGGSQRFSWDARFAQKVVDYLPLFVNNKWDTSKFNLVYDTAAVILDMHGEASYAVNEKFRLLISGDFYNYSLKNQAKAWHMPSLKGKLSASYQLNKKLGFTADLFAYNKSFAKAPDASVKTLKGIVDINIGSTYKFSDSFYIFVEANNLTAAKYQRWYAYPNYGFNAMGGLIMTF